MISDCKAEGKENIYKFEIRAVNIAENGEHLFGNWSEAGQGNCYSSGETLYKFYYFNLFNIKILNSHFLSGPSYWIILLFWVMGGLSGIMLVFTLAYGGRR